MIVLIRLLYVPDKDCGIKPKDDKDIKDEKMEIKV